ncbi:DUF1816 domain-containing protein [Phormidium sp. LEGE 05292]|nr:DUF1816 domain-containing protein [Phormidium sp. LEGE 05292]
MLLTNLTEQEKIEFAWWVEIVTLFPSCSYYFGPFASIQEAACAHVGYLEDLKQEGAKGITLQIKLCQPKMLTNFYEPG